MERVKIFFYRYKSNIFRRTLKNILFFMTLLLVLQFNNTKCYAKEFNHGDMRSFVFELPDNLGKYTITGVYNSERSGNKWDVTSKNELVKRTSFLTSDDEKKFNSLSLFGAIIEGFRDSKNESGYSEYIVEFLETIAKLESDVNSEFILTSDLVPLTNREVLKKAKSGSITWGTSADSAKKYDKILKQGGKANYLIPEFLTENVNPFNMTNDMSVDEFFNAIKINNLRADHYMNDQSLFSLIVNSNSIPNICKDAGSIDVDEIISEDDELIDGHGYKARIIVDEIRIYISLYNRKGEAITSFILGDLFGTDTFKEKRYTNNSLKMCI